MGDDKFTDTSTFFFVAIKMRYVLHSCRLRHLQRAGSPGPRNHYGACSTELFNCA